jgi:hypothetical protein
MQAWWDAPTSLRSPQVQSQTGATRGRRVRVQGVSRRQTAGVPPPRRLSADTHTHKPGHTRRTHTAHGRRPRVMPRQGTSLAHSASQRRKCRPTRKGASSAESNSLKGHAARMLLPGARLVHVWVHVCARAAAAAYDDAAGAVVQSQQTPSGAGVGVCTCWRAQRMHAPFSKDTRWRRMLVLRVQACASTSTRANEMHRRGASSSPGTTDWGAGCCKQSAVRRWRASRPCGKRAATAAGTPTPTTHCTRAVARAAPQEGRVLLLAPHSRHATAQRSERGAHPATRPAAPGCAAALQAHTPPAPGPRSPARTPQTHTHTHAHTHADEGGDLRRDDMQARFDQGCAAHNSDARADATHAGASCRSGRTATAARQARKRASIAVMPATTQQLVRSTCKVHGDAQSHVLHAARARQARPASKDMPSNHTHTRTQAHQHNPLHASPTHI